MNMTDDQCGSGYFYCAMEVLFRGGSLNVPEFPPSNHQGVQSVGRRGRRYVRGILPNLVGPHTFYDRFSQMRGRLCVRFLTNTYTLYTITAPTSRSRYSSCQLMYFKSYFRSFHSNSFLIVSQDARVSKKQ